jgi:hypothetical protein
MGNLMIIQSGKYRGCNLHINEHEAIMMDVNEELNEMEQIYEDALKEAARKMESLESINRRQRVIYRNQRVSIDAFLEEIEELKAENERLNVYHSTSSGTVLIWEEEKGRWNNPEVNEIKSLGVREAIAATRVSLERGGNECLCRVVDLEEYADKIVSK